MKKVLFVLLVLCVATTGAFAQKGPIEGAGNLGSFKLELKDNIRDGKNFQGVIENEKLLLGNKAAKGDTFILKVTYTASRDLSKPIGVGFATMGRNRWVPLSWRQKSIDIPNPTNGGVELPASKAGEVVSQEIKITIYTSAADIKADSNTLVFSTMDTAGPVTLTFTEFNLVRQ